MKALICFGTRPEAIKMVPVILEMRKRNISYAICITAQHREMLDSVMHFFDIKADYDLDIMKPDQSLNYISSAILSKIDPILEKENPDIVLVHGDTTTSTMVALAAYHRKCKVAHVEAGLRTFNKWSPFPEEMNRQLTGLIADYHFAPTQQAAKNLLEAGVHSDHIVVTGNTVVDTLLLTVEKLKDGADFFSSGNVKKTIPQNSQIILVTGHRRENFGAGFERLCQALLEIVEQSDAHIVYPVHLNPNVQKIVFEKLSNRERIHLIEPLEYPAFVWLMKQASLIISDSGGIQEEAPSLGIPVLVTRNETEREEGVEAGCSYLVGTDVHKIVSNALAFLHPTASRQKMTNPYGDGKAAHRVLDYLEDSVR